MYILKLLFYLAGVEGSHRGSRKQILYKRDDILNQDQIYEILISINIILIKRICN
ncbi:hypothetical protein pb186bvf_020319 [Paramecium bursaria]